MTPPMDEARSDAGGGGSDGEIDLVELAARVERCEQHNAQCQVFQAAVVETLDRQLRFTAKELRALLS
jgi:hypothetical protein